ncbi:ankyrin repeat domain-containing protein [Cellulomonas shaoxiangyii]|uniref:Ankyrin repeat domain-containing protein n=1 Tax=Cellulomonas shaoxiangyii TaxID=2566013 RepID=A0A4P7SQG3_9CELL|nr:ankyrin repeat domain-containing protein [Cellulomonas shaoxiangyii]QCB95003.1 ankyrin repeat domain-containing protein [Cellulomonas shaoxiangyii]TGY85290.1 ankyrin repeat domain-containing protein [Cellulomonas shaoxiangyii]
MTDQRAAQLPKDVETLLAAGDLARLTAVLDTCPPDARGGYAQQTALAFDDCPDELARWLVARGADLQAPDRWGSTPLHTRARSRRGRIGVLLELGADVHHDAGRLGTPLHAAAAGRNVEHARLLLAHGAAVDAVDAHGRTPLEVALHDCPNVALVPAAALAEVLLDAGARPTPAATASVEEIGRQLERFRDRIAPGHLAPADAALTSLYRRFAVAPVPRHRRHDGTSPIAVTSTRWHEQHAELWELLVPAEGAATTVQGEVVRITGRISHELTDNGGANWDADFRAMARALAEHVGTGVPLDAPDLVRVGAIVDELGLSASGDTDRLAELAVAWVLRNPEPRPLGRPAYRR